MVTDIGGEASAGKNQIKLFATVSNGKTASEKHASNDSQGHRHQGWRYEEDGHRDRLKMGDSQTDGQGTWVFVCQPPPRFLPKVTGTASREEQEVLDPR